MILALMENNSVRLVDNDDFIEWATEETLPELRDDTRMVILREDGAEFITNVDALRVALDAMLNERYDRQLDFQIVALPPVGLSLETCSERTQMVDQANQSLSFDGIDSSINRLNKEDYLREVQEWVEDQTLDEDDQAFFDFLRELYFG